jgi:coenzyme F420 hydrogenase subunit beta
MPDYRVWMRHENGYTEKVGYFELDLNRMGSDIFPDSCMSCFDYTNSLSDITVGYLGASMPYQWVLVRTETGEELFEMLRPYLEFGDIKEKGDYHKAVRASIAMLDNPRQAPKLVAKMLTFLMKFRGLRGVNFARGVLTMKWARNLHFIRQRFPQDEGRLVPEYAKRVLKKYGM